MNNEVKEKTNRFKDKRCVQLKKAFSLEARFLNQDGDNSKMSLGYFDSIEIAQFPQEDGDWLETAWKSSIQLSGQATTNIYEHSLYITAQGDAQWKKKIDAFWGWNKPFQMITFVHFVTHSGTPRDFFTEVEQETEKIISSHIRKEVNVVCYHSIDVSDMILIWKSDYLVETLKCLREIYLLDQIGDLHTICSFTPNSIVSTKQDEEIPYVSFRFGVKDAKYAQDFFAQIKENQVFEFMKNAEPYITTGTEDIDVMLKNVKVSDFLLLMKMISEDSSINNVFCNAFSESATHLGIPDSVPKKPREIIVSHELTERCELLLRYFQEVRKTVNPHETEPMYSWVKLVSIQLNALVSMSRLCVLDRFCYLIMDSVQAFCEIFDQSLERNEKMTSERLRKIQKFVRSWGVLMDQAVRADGQFTQDTGVNPVIYEIPVSLLEFYIAFTRRCMRLLQMSDGEETKDHGLFLMPNLCRRTKVEDVFDNPPPAKRLLYVDIPLDYLYSTRQVFYQLCHEISHFCGEKPRSRTVRANTFIMNCAQLIVNALHIESRRMVFTVYNELHVALDPEQT